MKYGSFRLQSSYCLVYFAGARAVPWNSAYGYYNQIAFNIHCTGKETHILDCQVFSGSSNSKFLSVLCQKGTKRNVVCFLLRSILFACWWF